MSTKMLPILQYADLDTSSVQDLFDKVLEQLARGDFRSADVKKMPQQGFYRARLDIRHRLLFKWTEYEGQKHLLLLEVILHHRYEDSRFLKRGAHIDEEKLQKIASPEELEEPEPMVYLNAKESNFYFLDKILSFDELQKEVLHSPLPLILIGSAGSGKTALGLEKLRMLPGKLLYSSRSSYLIDNARQLYSSFAYNNPQQEVDFFSFRQLLFRVQRPKSQAMSYRSFVAWFERHKKFYPFEDPQQLYEEFRGVLTGSSTREASMSEESYLGLGTRESIFSKEERPELYRLFLKYLDCLEQEGYYDESILAYEYQNRVRAKYDYLFIDEVQDLTISELSFLLKHIKKPGQFLLCGDANQIVHPNFFSWANVKKFFFQEGLEHKVMAFLYANYRNSPEVSDLANRLLKIKYLRFGSIDRESNYLIKANKKQKGQVQVLAHKKKILDSLNANTRRSARVAVLVLRESDKADARKFFDTPLLFDVQEAKGLEYDKVILYNIISQESGAFEVLCQGLDKEQVEALQELDYGRSRDKSDKSLDKYKFYVNALYVALSRSISDLWIVEQRQEHKLLELLGLKESEELQAELESSDESTWRREAQRLEKQGKREQAEAILRDVLQVEEVPWKILATENYGDFIDLALNDTSYNKAAKDLIFSYHLFYGFPFLVPVFLGCKYKKAERWEAEMQALWRRELKFYAADKVQEKAWLDSLRRYGLDYRNPWNITPLMAALRSGAKEMASFLIDEGADTQARDNFGFQALDILLLSVELASAAPELINIFYPHLAREPIQLRYMGHFFFIEPREPEYLCLRYLLATLRLRYFSVQSNLIQEKKQLAVSPKAISELFRTWQLSPSLFAPESYSPEALSLLFKRNELRSKDPNNRYLFIDLDSEDYILNPSLEVEDWPESEIPWVSLNNILCIDQLKLCPSIEDKSFFEYLLSLEEATKESE